MEILANASTKASKVDHFGALLVILAHLLQLIAVMGGVVFYDGGCSGGKTRIFSDNGCSEKDPISSL